MKRSIKRAVFVQIVLFSMNGIYTMLKDKDQRIDALCYGQYLSRNGNCVERRRRQTVFNEDPN